MYKKIFLAISSLFLISGCSTTQITVEEAQYVKPLAFQSPSHSTDGKVTIIRDGGMLGAASRAYISVDETQVAALRAKEKTIVYLPVGKHFFSLKMGITQNYVPVELKTNDDALLRIYGDVINGTGFSQIK